MYESGAYKNRTVHPRGLVGFVIDELQNLSVHLIQLLAHLCDVVLEPWATRRVGSKGKTHKVQRTRFRV